MDPRLEAITGPLRGAVFSLSAEEVCIGRESSNLISILDGLVSRRHCVIRKEAQGFTITDLDSLNGTFVNGVPVKERILENGDEIKIGSSLFLFALSRPEADSPEGSVQFDQRELFEAATLTLRREDAFCWEAAHAPNTPQPPAQILRDWHALLKISKAINSIRDLEGFERQLLELVFEIAPADRGAILLAGDRPGDFASLFGWDRFSGADRPVEVSRSIIDQVLRDGVAVFSNDVPASEASSRAESRRQIQSVLAVPLEVFDRVRGVIYLDSADPEVRFDERLVNLLAAVGGVAAVALENARSWEWLRNENRRLQAEINLEHQMVGESPRMRAVYKFLAKVGPTDSTVLICGESGTGKELVAQAIHRNSGRAAKPFVAINCAAITETLLESDLFGHEKGAFTGAIAQKKGKLEVADGGTVFLDEVGELPIPLQAKLLRVLQEREFERVGSTRPIRVDIRLIAATNKDLGEAVSNGTFRRDLYYRLNVVSLTLPPLRERREDIPLLATYFAAKHSGRCKRQIMGISPEARSCLFRYDWPGNVRELENAIERAVVLGSSDLILPEDLPDAVLERVSSSGTPINRYHDAIQETKRELILKAVEQAGGNYLEAAKLLGVHPNYLHRLIRNLNLKAAIKTQRYPAH